MRLLILGAGAMAVQHAEGFGEVDGVELAAVVDPNPVRLSAFGDQFGIERRFETCRTPSTGTGSTRSPTSRRTACITRQPWPASPRANTSSAKSRSRPTTGSPKR